jgi:hypothetical protein
MAKRGVLERRRPTDDKRVIVRDRVAPLAGAPRIARPRAARFAAPGRLTQVKRRRARLV